VVRLVGCLGQLVLRSRLSDAGRGQRMASSGSPAETAVNAVARARKEVNNIRAIMARLEESATQAPPPSALNAVKDRINQQDRALIEAELLVEKTKDRLRSAAIGRQSEGSDIAELAKRTNDVMAATPTIDETMVPPRLRSAKELASAPQIGKEKLPVLAAEISTRSQLQVEVIHGDALKVVVGDTLQAGIWFETDGSRLRPEVVTVCAVHGERLDRFRVSKYVVFQVLTERSNAALRLGARIRYTNGAVKTHRMAGCAS